MDFWETGRFGIPTATEGHLVIDSASLLLSCRYVHINGCDSLPHEPRCVSQDFSALLVLPPLRTWKLRIRGTTRVPTTQPLPDRAIHSISTTQLISLPRYTSDSRNRVQAACLQYVPGTPFGNSFTATHDREGLCVKYFSYTPFISAKLSIVVRNAVTYNRISLDIATTLLHPARPQNTATAPRLMAVHQPCKAAH